MEYNGRQKAILAWVRQQNHVAVDAIARRFGVTTQTIRRDVNPLCERGLLRRRYGGVSWPDDIPANGLAAPSAEAARSGGLLSAIAKRVATDVPEGATISLGSGETVERIALALSCHQSLRILTNNFRVAAAVSGNPDIEVIVSGGQYRHQHHDVVGSEVTSFFSSFVTDIGLIGAGSIDSTHGLMEGDIREAEVSRAIITNTRQRWLIADSSTWYRKAPCKVASFRYVDRFFTDQLSDAHRSELPDALDVIQIGLSGANVA